jgi:hypothetical protein
MKRCQLIFLTTISAFILTLSVSDLSLAQPNRFTSAIKSRIVLNTIDTEKRVDVVIDGKLLCSYSWGSEMRHPGLSAIYTPKGNAITRGYPVTGRANERTDNPGEFGFFFATGAVNGVNYWNSGSAESKGPFGRIVHKSVKSTSGGKQIGLLEVESDWLNAQNKVVATETSEYRFSGMGSDRTIDRTITLTANEDLILSDNEFGLAAIRLCRELEIAKKLPQALTDNTGKPSPTPVGGQIGNPSGKYMDSEDHQQDSISGKRSEWVLVNGQLTGEPVSVALIDHRGNPGFPTYWNVPGTGLLAANPLGQGFYSDGQEVLNLRIARGKSITFRYRLILQTGRQLVPSDVERTFAAFNTVEKEED